MISLVYWDINNTDISESKYIAFLKLYYKDDTEVQKRYERVKWYRKCRNYKILIAIDNGEIVGQTSAYQCTAIINGEEQEWWWSVDTFVLSKMRGKGVGKKLQLKLHQDLSNFSSLWYSPSNGIIKKKCGANEITFINFNYYPVNNFFCFLFNIAVRKLFNINFKLESRIPYLYFYINNLKKRKYITKEISFPNTVYDNFIDDWLNQHDIYIKRSKEYLNWKYISNPTLDYHSLAIYNNSNVLSGIVIFSNVFKKNIFNTTMKVITILDVFIDPNSFLSYNDILYYAIKYYKKKNMSFDGIISLQDANYYPKFRYPLKGNPLLSTSNVICKKPYFAYSDQDMEQII